MKKKLDELLKKYINEESVNQLIFVKCKTESFADVKMYIKENNAWKLILKCEGYIGKNGLGKEKEGDLKTPIGEFGIITAFGIKENPGTTMPYIKIKDTLYCCSDKAYYNQIINVEEKRHKCKGEHLIDYVPEYNYAMFIDYNSEKIYGKGSAIFLHCKGEKNWTAGCIAINEEDIKYILKNSSVGMKICIY